MNHPLYSRRWLNIWRETVCWAIGHQWVHSPRRTTEWYGTEDYETRAPYVLRKRSGNILYEDVAWWSAKCRRCRHKQRPDHGEPHEVWHRILHRAVACGIQSARWHVESMREDRSRYPLWVHALAVPMTAISFAEQFTLHLLRFDGSGVPASWMSWVWDIQHGWYWLLDRNAKGSTIVSERGA